MSKIIAALIILPVAINITLPPNEVDDKSDKISADAPPFFLTTLPKLAAITMIIQTSAFIHFCYQNSCHNWDFIDSISFISVIVGAGLRKWSFITLGRFFTYQLAIRKGHRLVKTGPYQYLRHPSYTGLGLCVFGFTWFVFNPKTFVNVPFLEPFLYFGCRFVSVMFPLAMIYRISGEEVMLEKEFGKEWQEYAQTTKRVIPFIF
jgi:protein-S-isoprenylcysteine O-methyltransferase Ste14